MHLCKYKPEGIVLSMPENREYLSNENGLIRAMNEGVILEAMAVRCDASYTLTVDLGCMLGIIDRGDVEYDRSGGEVRDIAIITRVGKAVCFKVMGFYYQNGIKVARLSRKEAQRECYEVFLSDCISGDIIDKSEITPHPMSTNAPKFSRCVIFASIISPGIRPDKNSSLHRSCAFLLERIAYEFPVMSVFIFSTTKQTVLPTLEIRAISRVVPTDMPTAPSNLGIIPFIHPRFTIRLCSESHI